MSVDIFLAEMEQSVWKKPEITPTIIDLRSWRSMKEMDFLSTKMN